jgi:hypothetical protein
MVSANAILAVATAVLALMAFTLISPLTRAQATNGLSPIPAPASCTYDGHPTSPLSQTTVATPIPISAPNHTITKHAEKEIYDCVISGSTKHYILDTTTWTTVTNQPQTISNAFVECAKDRATATVYSCQTETVGHTLLTTSGCAQLGLGFPQEMSTAVANGIAFTAESQKEIFKCNTSSGSVIQEVVIWTLTGDTTTSSVSLYAVETCQKPATITTGLPLLNCASTEFREIIA